MVDEGFGGREVLDKATGADFVEVMFASSLDEAKECCALLDDSHIPAKYEEEASAGEKGIAVLVPEEQFVEASEVLASRVQHGAAEEEEDELLKEDADDDAVALADEDDLEADDDDDDELDDDDADDDDDDDDEDEVDEY